MSFLWPQALLLLLAAPLLVRGVPLAGPAPGPAGRRAGRAGLRARPPRPGAPAGSATCRSPCSSALSCCWSAGLRPPGDERRAAAPGGHGDPRLRRVEQHAGRGSGADPDGRGQVGGARLRRAPARLDRDRRRRLQRRRAGHPAADHRQGRRAGRHRPPHPAGRHVAGAGHLHRRSTPSPASRSPSTRRRSTASDLESLDIGYYGSAPSCCCPTARTPPTRTRWPVAELASVAGVRIYPIGDRQPARARWSTSTASASPPRLDEAVLTEIAEVTGGTYFAAPRTRRRSPRSTTASTCALTTEAERTEVTAAVTGASIVLLVLGAALSLVWFGRLV